MSELQTLLIGLAIVAAGIALWPTLFLPVVGWSSLQRAFGIALADQPFTPDAIWLQGQSVGFHLVKETGVPLLTPFESWTDVWPMTASVSDAGLFLCAPTALGPARKAILIPWDQAVPEPEGPKGQFALTVLGGVVGLVFRGALANAVEGQLRLRSRRLDRQASQGVPG